ncbi:hypothetical protein [Gymnodinialimonas sp.]
MLKFLFGGKKTVPDVVIESDRARFERVVNELNELIDGLADKPRVTIDPATGHVLPETPEQFADEALALPAPEPEGDQDAGGDGPKGQEAMSAQKAPNADALAKAS